MIGFSLYPVLFQVETPHAEDTSGLSAAETPEFDSIRRFYCWELYMCNSCVKKSGTLIRTAMMDRRKEVDKQKESNENILPDPINGEKTSVKDWPSFLDIKGRVRRDPFEKFLQELPLSRSRAVMVLHFCWKEGSPESGRANILETADSYVADERVGFAEPAPGVELYLCPPHNKIVDMLVKHLSKSHTETLNSIDNGLIGIVVWRKAHVSSKKQNQSSLRRHQEKNSHANASVRTPPERPPAPPVSEPIDDIPPGFGPSASKDEDDLPEFDFVGGGSNPSGQGFSTQKLEARAPPPPRPVEQMRNLISKYGRGEMSSNGGVGVEIQPWNDDDDIPEWQPQMPSQQQQMPMPQPSLPLPPPPPPQPQAQLQSYSQQQNFAPPMPQPQMVTQQYYMPMQQHQLLPQQMVQHQIPNMIQGGQQVMVSSWPAQGATWTYQFGPNGLIMQPCNNYNGQQQQQQPYVGQYYGTQNGQINNTIWRPN
ncbi:hypothetical protein GIB67_019440 [Kingdonia uniflora]|uniref:Spen paralogue and orthologue SPOC C-terminal domain-containing protein n=1 Tax=Kingdonia uniflora TaxID=39325 RepID=A0A7J7MTZ7_9MAGN|nr:hypothetical protein GIB67_019440 [Kingdonia uniflora]